MSSSFLFVDFVLEDEGYDKGKEGAPAESIHVERQN